MTAAVIRIVAAVIRDDAGRALLVRKRGTETFMQPGGKREPGESDLEALSRELKEELGCGLRAGSERLFGRFSAPAANEPGHLVEATIYEVAVAGPIEAAAEIEALLWVDPAAPPDVVLAPLTRDHVLPRLRDAEQRFETCH